MEPRRSGSTTPLVCRWTSWLTRRAIRELSSIRLALMRRWKSSVNVLGHRGRQQGSKLQTDIFTHSPRVAAPTKTFPAHLTRPGAPYLYRLLATTVSSTVQG